jgi:hypothetical protein
LVLRFFRGAEGGDAGGVRVRAFADFLRRARRWRRAGDGVGETEGCEGADGGADERSRFHGRSIATV